MLQSYVIRPKEFYGDIPEAHEYDTTRENWQDTEVYIDEMIVKFYKRASHHEDLEDIFKQLKSFNTRLTLQSVFSESEKGSSLDTL